MNLIIICNTYIYSDKSYIVYFLFLGDKNIYILIENSYFSFLSFLDMTDENIIKEELNTSDDELFKRESLNSNIGGENSSDENLNDEENELDFYDFLEVVSDKFDNITTQSNSYRKKN